MRLTTSDREAFVHAVLDDVPQVDYEEEANRKARAAVVSLMPQEVQAVYHKFPNYLKNDSVMMPSGFSNIWMPSTEYQCLKKQRPELWAELEELARLQQEQEQEQENKWDALESQLRCIINTCRTLKQAKERLPEFVKYLPADRESTGVANLPVANVVADLMAAGWPKGKPKAKTAKKGAAK